MKPDPRPMAAAAAVAGAAAVRAEPVPATQPPRSFDPTAIDTFVSSQVRDKGHVGLSLAIMRDGKIVFAKGYGKRSLEPAAAVTADTPFAIGSICKQFTS